MTPKVLYFDFSDEAHDIETKLRETLIWYHRISNGKFPSHFQKFPRIDLPKPISLYAHQGGTGVWPYNSQMLAAAVTEGLHYSTFRSIQNGSCSIVCVVPPAFRPHTWSLPTHILPDGRKNGASHYTILPIRADRLTIAHELGHLLHGWPDLAYEPSLRHYCLMAGAGYRDGDQQLPMQPCGPLKRKAGWVGTLECKSITTAGMLSNKICAVFSINDKAYEFHRADTGRAEEIALFELRTEFSAIRPILLKRIPCNESTKSQPLLALVPEILLDK
jgi:M6 family metalloprotease-like protein